MTRKDFPIMAILCCLLFAVAAQAQKDYTMPKHALGLEVSQSITNLHESSRLYTGYGGSIAIPYQYAPKKSIWGIQSGVGLYLWGVQSQRTSTMGGWQYGRDKHSFYSIGIPVVLQLKVSRAFWFEGGAQINKGVYTQLDRNDWFQHGDMTALEMQAVFGFRYHIFRTLSIKARAHLGLNPAFINDGSPGLDNELVSFQRQTERLNFVALELGISYLFSLKK